MDGTQGLNRNAQFCFIQAKNDLQAVEFNLSKFHNQPHTLRAYRKELERLILWAVLVRGKPLSSLLVDDGEAYKNLLAAPLPAFCGDHAPRFLRRGGRFLNTRCHSKHKRC